MGAPTSPALANLVLGRVDRSLEKACLKKGVDYTRYADDLTFSGGREAVKMLGFATRLLQREGYELHPEKVNIFRRGRRDGDRTGRQRETYAAPCSAAQHPCRCACRSKRR